MFSNILSVELLKTKRSVLWALALLVPSLSIFLGVGNFLVNAREFIGPDDNLWVEAWSQVVIFYGMIFLPTLVGIYAVTICRFDHLTGGWKQILSFPISRIKLYFAKLFILYLLLAVTQLSLVGQYIFIGHIVDLSGTFVLKDFVLYGLFGWLASLPLASLQLWLAFNWRSFGLPLTVNIALTIPVLMVSQTPYAFYYPWAQPSMMMSPAYELFRPSYEELFAVFSVLLILFTTLGLLHFRRKEFA
ncbi:ABC transporter permease [Aeribacillus sp. FSL K6-1305]|uniref:ABC transporter permease n=1 Tax=Aeribacillus sp. FSL K6-1305 TaxID=2954569 RepID=UPI0030FDE86E